MLLSEHELHTLGALRVQPLSRPRRQTPADFSSLDKGLGLEFADYQLFQPGDDIRHVDWTHYHKDRRLVVRKYDQHESVRVFLMIDLSASMSCQGPEKVRAVQRLAAALALCLLRNGVKLLLCPVGQSQQRVPFSGWSRWQPCLESIEQLPVGGNAHVMEEVQQFHYLGTRTDHLVILSDFLDVEDTAAWDRYLAPLTERGSLIHPTCQADIEPPLEGGLTLEEAESTQAASLTVDRQVLLAYRDAYDAYYQQLNQVAQHHGCRYIRLRCEDPLERQMEILAPEGVLFV